MTENDAELAAWRRRVEYLEARGALPWRKRVDDDAAIFEKAIRGAVGMVQNFRRECQFDRARASRLTDEEIWSLHGESPVHQQALPGMFSTMRCELTSWHVWRRTVKGKD